MKVKNIRLARSIWLFDVQDLDPSGKIVMADIFDWIKTRYSFAAAPDLNTLGGASLGQGGQPFSAGAVFERGRFQTQDGALVQISKLTIYSDGVVVETPSSTADGDLFAGDLLESASREFSLSYDAETVRKRIYLSELVVQSDTALEIVDSRLASFAARIGEASSEEPKPRFQLAAVQFWTGPNDAGRHKMFTLERQAGKAFAERRYFSQAPLQTDMHFGLLQELDRVLARAAEGAGGTNSAAEAGRPRITRRYQFDKE